MVTSDKLILPLLRKDDHMLDTKHKDTTWGGPPWTLMVRNNLWLMQQMRGKMC